MYDESQWWFQCRACGAPCVRFLQTTVHAMKNTVAHCKPASGYGRINATGCRLFTELDAGDFWLFHENQPRLPQPPLPIIADGDTGLES